MALPDGSNIEASAPWKSQGAVRGYIDRGKGYGCDESVPEKSVRKPSAQVQSLSFILCKTRSVRCHGN